MKENFRLNNSKPEDVLGEFSNIEAEEKHRSFVKRFKATLGTLTATGILPALEYASQAQSVQEKVWYSGAAGLMALVSIVNIYQSGSKK
jgi:hypothetical protein